MTRDEIAMELFKSGKNCAQAVLLAFLDLTGLDEQTALKATAGFGSGVGRMRSACGALTGAAVALGLIRGIPADIEEKTALNADIQKIAFALQAEYSSFNCDGILGENGPGSPVPEPRTPENAQKPCKNCVGLAARMLEGIVSK